MPRERRVKGIFRRTPVKAVPPNLPPTVEVRKSTIPKAGKGMFAKQKLEKGSALGEYTGTLLLLKDVQGLPPGSDAYYINADEEAGTVLDGSAYSNAMRWVNHGGDKANVFAELQDDGRIIYKLKKSVSPGQELFTDYGYEPGSGSD